MTLADLQRRLRPLQENPHPPQDLLVGETAFCTNDYFVNNKDGHYMWVSILGKQEGTGVYCDYQIAVDGKEEPIWVSAQFFWTKTQVQALPDRELTGYGVDLVLPEGVQVKNPAAVVQAAINLLRDVIVRGRCGSTNLAAVKCDVDGLCLGHFYKLGDALGQEVCDVINQTKGSTQHKSLQG